MINSSKTRSENQEQLNNYRKKFEEIKHRAENDLEEDLDWYLLNEEYPELVTNLLDSLQELVNYQPTQLSKEEIPSQNTQVNWADYEHFFGSKD